MSFVGIIAAGGSSTRTGLGEYTTKAALRLRTVPGQPRKSLLAHQIDFLRRSGASHAIVCARPQHVGLLARGLSPEDRRYACFATECGDGWAGTVEGAAAFVGEWDEVVLLPCDNLQTAHRVERLSEHEDLLFTYTSAAVAPTNGAALVRTHASQGQWREVLGGKWVEADVFTGYVVGWARTIFETIKKIKPSPRGEKEIVSLLAEHANKPRTRAVPYPGKYEDVRDLKALARLDAGHRADDPVDFGVGAGVLLVDPYGRVLLSERQDGRGWVPPGGLVEDGESYAQAAVRECAEEVGVAVAPGDRGFRLLGVYPCTGKSGEPAVSVIFRADAPTSAAFARVAEGEVKAVRWFTREDAAAVEIPFELREAVEDCFAGRELDCR